MRDEVDALLEVLTGALVIRRLRLALQPLDAVDAVRCGQSAVLRVVQVVGVRGQLHQTAVGHFGCLIPLEEKAIRFRVVVCADAFADQCNDSLHAGFLQNRVRNIVIGAITVVKGDHDRPLGHGFLSGSDVDQIRREQRRVAVVFAALQLMQDTKNAPVSPKRTRRCQNFFICKPPTAYCPFSISYCSGFVERYNSCVKRAKGL